MCFDRSQKVAATVKIQHCPALVVVVVLVNHLGPLCQQRLGGPWVVLPVPADFGSVDPLLCKDAIEVGGGLIPVGVGDMVLDSDGALDDGSVLIGHTRHGLRLVDRDAVELGNKGLEQGHGDVEFV